MSADRFLLPDAQVEERLRARMAMLVGVSIAISLLLIAGAVAVFGPAGTWTAGVWLGMAAAFALHMTINIRIGRGLAKRSRQIGGKAGRVSASDGRAGRRHASLALLAGGVVAPLVLMGGIIGLRDAVTTYDLAMSLVAIPLSGLMVALGLAGLLGRK